MSPLTKKGAKIKAAMKKKTMGSKKPDMTPGMMPASHKHMTEKEHAAAMKKMKGK